MEDTNVLEPIRSEFGIARSSCSCQLCEVNCRFLPGYLIPSDLGRLIPPGDDPLVWAESHLLASPGALLLGRDSLGAVRRYRVLTLVPALAAGGGCHWFAGGRCTVHAAASFGCAFFEANEPAELSNAKSLAGLREVARAWGDPDRELYPRIWRHLKAKGLGSPGPERQREAMREWLRENPPAGERA